MSEVYEKLMKCYKSVREKTDFVPEAALILGSGLGDYADDLKIEASINYADIEGFPVSTVKGHKGRFVFAHVEGWQWRPDMIWFDNLNSVRTVSYYVQQLYAQNKGTNVLPLTMNKKPVTGAEGQNGLFASAVYDKDKNELIVKVANTSDKTQPVSLTFEGLKKQDVLSEGRCITLSSLDQDKDNTLEQPFAITPQETPVTINGHALTTELGPNTFAVYKFTKK